MGIKDLSAPTMTVEEVLDGLDAETKSALHRGLRDMRLSVFEVAAACRDDGYEIRPREIQVWRAHHMTELA